MKAKYTYMYTCPRKWCIIKGVSLYVVSLSAMYTVLALKRT